VKYILVQTTEGQLPGQTFGKGVQGETFLEKKIREYAMFDFATSRIDAYKDVGELDSKILAKQT